MAVAIAAVAVGLGGWNVPSHRTGLFAGVMALAAVAVLARTRATAGAPGRREPIARLVGACAATALAWLGLAAHCIVGVATRGEAFYPLWLSGDVLGMVERAGGRVAAIERYGIDAVQMALADMPGISVAEPLSLALLLAAYVATFCLLMVLMSRVPGTPVEHDRALRARSVFISYRRSDSAAHARLIHEQLRERGARVVLDVDAFAPGVDFVAAIDDVIAASDAVVVVIGPAWLRDAQGRSRLEQPDDIVRREIAGSLARAKPVLPVLVDGAQMPPASALPPDIAPLASRNALSLGHESFRRDIERLLGFVAAVDVGRR